MLKQNGILLRSSRYCLQIKENCKYCQVDFQEIAKHEISCEEVFLSCMPYIIRISSNYLNSVEHALNPRHSYYLFSI